MFHQFHNDFQPKTTPKRIVSLVPSQTELLVHLGLEQNIVGVTKFCVHPEYLRREKKIVGGTKQVNFKKIRALQPDIILCNKEENTKDICDMLANTAPVHVSDIFNLKDVFDLIHFYGQLFDVESNAANVITQIEKERQQFQKFKEGKTSLKVAYFIWKNPWMIAASNTFIDTMILEAGFLNVFENQSRYPVIGLDDIRLKTADCIWLSSEPFPFKEKDVEALKVQFPDKKISVVDGELFSWYGNRLKKSYRYFEELHQ